MTVLLGILGFAALFGLFGLTHRARCSGACSSCSGGCPAFRDEERNTATATAGNGGNSVHEEYDDRH